MAWIQKDYTIVNDDDSNMELRVRQITDAPESVEIDIVRNGSAQESITLTKAELLEFMAHVTAGLDA